MSAGTFACIIAMQRRGRALEEITDLRGLARTDPGLALAMAVFMFSMAGIPPLSGFFGKLYVFLAAVQGGMWTLAVVGVLTSVVGAYYYIRIVKVMYSMRRRHRSTRAQPRYLRRGSHGAVHHILLYFSGALRGCSAGGSQGAVRMKQDFRFMLLVIDCGNTNVVFAGATAPLGAALGGSAPTRSAPRTNTASG